MTGLKQAFSTPKVQAFCFFLLVFLVYLQLVKPKEITSDLEIVENRAYLAVGLAGIQVMDITDPNNPYLITTYDTPGSANQIAIVDKHIYVADGETGLVILSTEDPKVLNFVGSVNTPGTAEDLTVSGKNIYLADGKSGLQIINVDDPKKPTIVSEYKPGGYAYRVLAENKIVFLGDQSEHLWIIDCSDPKSPVQKSLIETQENVLGLTLNDNLAYLATGKTGLAIVNISTLENPEAVGFYDTRGNATSVTIGGKYAYIADDHAGVTILEITNPSQPTEVGKFEQVDNAIDIDVRNNQIYVADSYEGLIILDQNIKFAFELLSPVNQPGNVEAVATNDKYAFLASESQGVRVLDVSDPQAPKEVGLYDTPEQALGITVAGDYIYVADGKGDIRILFISNSDADSVELAEKAHLELAGESHEIYLVDKLGYVAAGDGGLRVVNLENPASPKEIGFEDKAKNALGVVVLGEYAYVASGANGLQIVNVLDPTKPAVIRSLDTDGDARAISLIKSTTAGGRTYVLIADGHNGLRVIDVTDPHDPKEVGANLEPEYAYDVITSELLGKYVYVSGRADGLWVVDVSDPTRPKEIGFEDTPGEAHGLAYMDSKVFVANYDRGMSIADVTSSTNPTSIGFYDVPRQVGDVAVEGMAYLIDSWRGLRVEDVQDPKNPREIGFYDTAGHSQGLAIEGNYAYLGAANNLMILDISKPTNPTEVKPFGISTPVTAVMVKDDYAYVTHGEGGLRLVQIKDPYNPASAGVFNTSGNATDVYVSGIYAYIADGEGGVSIVNVSDKNHPQTTSLLDQIKDGQGVWVTKNSAYIAAGEEGIYVFDVSKPAAPVQKITQDTPGVAQDLAVVDDFLFLADGASGIRVYYILYKDQLPEVGAYQIPGKSVALDVVPVKVNEDKPRHFYIYIASDELGMQIVDASQTMSPLEIGLCNTTGIYPLSETLRATPAAMRAVLTGHGSDVPQKYRDSLRTYLFDLLVFMVTLVLWMGIVAQFVLPVESSEYRLEALNRLSSYMRGKLLAAAFVKEGVVFLGPGKTKTEDSATAKAGDPGVVLVDASSAIILQKYPRPSPQLIRFISRLLLRRTDQEAGTERRANTKNIRIEGPGLVFTQQSGFPTNQKYSETLLGTADLRPQVRFRPSVNGYTHDGIEVRANVFTVFTIGDPPAVLHVGYYGEEKAANLRVINVEEKVDESVGGLHPKKMGKFIKEFSDELDLKDKEEIHRSVQALTGTMMVSKIYQEPTEIRFSADQQRIFAAVFSQAYDTQEQRYLDWTELPIYAAVEVFRGMLVQEMYDSLYMPQDAQDFPLSRMRGSFSKKVRNLGILAYQYVKRRDGQPLKEGQVWEDGPLSFYPPQDLHQPKVLRTRGIKILVAGFSGMEPTSDKVKDRMLDYWSAHWEQEAKITTASYELNAMRIRNLARAQAQSEMVLALAQIMQNESISQEAMAVRIFQALEIAAADSKTQQLLPHETIAMLRTLRGWLMPGGDEGPFEGLLPPPSNPSGSQDSEGHNG